MKKLALASSIIATLAMAAHGEDQTKLLSKISLKEKQLTEIQKELQLLRSELSKPSRSSYTVKTGDTVHSIARRHQVSASDLMKWNDIADPTKLGIGENLVISGTRAKETSTTAASSDLKSKGYTVAKGDTFYSIARRHEMTLKQLKALNPDVSTHLIAPGQTVMVSGKAKAPIAAPIRPVDKPAPKPTKIKEIKKPVIQTTEKPSKVSKPKDTEKIAMPNVVREVTLPPVIEEVAIRSAASTVILTEEMTFDRFANKHQTTTDQLNSLNGWNLPKATVLARGSEIHIPN